MATDEKKQERVRKPPVFKDYKQKKKRDVLAHPLAKSRAKHALQWCLENLSTTEYTPVHARVLDEQFGNSSSRISRYLRDTLLERKGKYKIGKFSYKYRLIAEGVRQLSPDAVIPELPEGALKVRKLEAKYADELASLNFNYSLKSDRYWHPLQFMKKDLKSAFWQKHGLPFDYDIQACAPTLFAHAAKEAGLPDDEIAPLLAYVNDRNNLRARVAALTGTTPSVAKDLINALYNGAPLSTSRQFCSIFRALEDAGLTYVEATIAINRLKEDVELTSLRGAIRQGWKQISTVLDRKHRTGKTKAGFYFALEREVLDVIKSYLDARSIKYFTEHDGFKTSASIDLRDLTREIRDRQHGLVLSFSSSSLSPSLHVNTSSSDLTHI